MKYLALLCAFAICASEIAAQQKCPTIAFAKNFNAKRVSIFKIKFTLKNIQN